LGLYAPKWQHAKFPNLPAAGRFEYEVFDPAHWVADYPNAAFRNENPADRAWAARKIAAFTDEEIRSIVSTGEYTDQAAADWVARCLIERRRKIVNAFLDGSPGMDHFEVREGRLEWVYVGPGRPPAPTVHWAVFNNDTGENRFIARANSPLLPPVREPVDYLVAEISGVRGPAISVYVRTKASQAFVVGVERHFPNIARN
jgi:hypothetical protein